MIPEQHATDAPRDRGSRLAFLLRAPVPRGVVIAVAVAAFGASLVAQRGAPPAGSAPQPQPARTARAIAPVEMTGYWVAVVSEDWRWRMVTPPRGDTASVPMNAEGRKVTAAWDLAADTAAGNQCKAFGIGGIMRQPGRLHVDWQDENTLKIDFDAGTQTRLLHFDPAAKPAAERTWQGFSRATWEGPGVGRGAPPVGDVRVTGGGLLTPVVPGGGGQGLRGGPPPRGLAAINRGGNIKVVTTNFREGYLRKNGVPYSENATITEYFHRLPRHPNGDEWLHVLQIVEDPKYLVQPFYTSTHFRLEADGSKFKPTPCETAAPLPVAARR
jgi:hypothetical protein